MAPTVTPEKLSDLPILGVDIGGTKIAVGLVSSTGHMSHIERVPTPAAIPGDAMWDALNRVMDATLTAAGNPRIGGVGVGCAGPMIWPEGVVSPTNILPWREFPLRRKLRERFVGLPVRLHNDAICMAAGEHWLGAARGHDNAIGMVVSTGVGGGLISGGRLVDGGFGNAGHIGHMVADPNGPLCRCGGRGCLEAIARGPATVAWAVEQGWTPSRTGSGLLDGRSLAADARDGDLIAKAAFHRAGTALGSVLASVAALLDLDIAVIGGGMIQSGELLIAPILLAFEAHAGMQFVKRMKIVPAQLDQEAGIVGAAALFANNDQYWSPGDD
jgi:glucokinase